MIRVPPRLKVRHEQIDQTAKRQELRDAEK